MLTPTMIAAESVLPALTSVQNKNLTLLVKGAFPAYISLFATALSEGLAEEMANPSVRGQVLKAVLTQLDALPAEVVESQGRIDSPTFFASIQNWKSLALDVLNEFGILIPVTGSTMQSWGVVQRTVEDSLLNDNIQLALKEDKVGKRY